MGSLQGTRRSARASASIRFTSALRGEYDRLFATCEIRPGWLGRVDRVVGKIGEDRARYEVVGNLVGVPWAFIGAIHNLESSLSFKKHLHNGDPLTGRTVREPAGRPAAGEPPFLWEHSAHDALVLHGLDRWRDWSIEGILFQLERYNCWGYRLHHPEVLSPYLWSGSRHYAAGKYTDDHTFSLTAVSAQVGAAVVLRRMAERREMIPIRPRSPGSGRRNTKKRPKERKDHE